MDGKVLRDVLVNVKKTAVGIVVLGILVGMAVAVILGFYYALVFLGFWGFVAVVWGIALLLLCWRVGDYVVVDDK